MKTDYPDPDVIRVGNAYYMASTTMYFFPGCAILRSYDLVNWEIVNYVFDKLEDSSAENLEREESIYGHGMWAPTLRFHNGIYYIAFSSVDIKKTTFLPQMILRTASGRNIIWTVSSMTYHFFLTMTEGYM
jgi:beta-xylosidase